MTTEEKIKRADKIIQKYNVQDDDLKQEIYLASLQAKRSQDFYHSYQKLLSNNSEDNIEVLLSDMPDEDVVALLQMLHEDRYEKEMHALANDLLKEQLSYVLNDLTDRQQGILKYRFDDELTLNNIGKQYGVSGERIREIEVMALRILRHPSRSRKLRIYYDE